MAGRGKVEERGESRASTGEGCQCPERERRREERREISFKNGSTLVLLVEKLVVIKMFLPLVIGRNYGPPGTKQLIYFIDDMNMPEVDTYGTVQPHTLIRQHLDYQHWLVSSNSIVSVHYCIVSQVHSVSFVIALHLRIYKSMYLITLYYLNHM